MPAVDWGSIPSDVLASISQKCSSESVSALRAVSRHWHRTEGSFRRCRYGHNAALANPFGFQIPPLSAYAQLNTVEIVGVEILGASFEALLANRTITTLAVRECLIEVAVDRLFTATNLQHLCLASSTIINQQIPAHGESSRNIIQKLMFSGRQTHACDEDGDVVMADEPFAGNSGMCCLPESALVSLDLSGVQGIEDHRLATGLSSCRRLVALRLSVTHHASATLSALAKLPNLAHLELSTAHWHPSVPDTLPDVLEELCVSRAGQYANPREAPPPNDLLAVLPDCAPWWKPAAQPSPSSSSTASCGPLRATLQLQSPLHLVVDFPIITSQPRNWLTNAFASVPFRALTIRQPDLTEPPACVQLAAAHCVSSSRSVPALPGPATLVAQATPDAARALHALLPDLLMGRTPLSHFQLLGIEITEAVIRQMRMMHSPLQSLCLHNCDLDAPRKEQQSPIASQRSSLDSNDGAALKKQEPAPLSPAEMRARMAARWRLPASATIRQLVDTQATEHLQRLEVVDLPGVNDTVLRRIRSQAHALKHLAVCGNCNVTVEGMAELRWMKLHSLHVCNLPHQDIGTHGLQMLASGGNGLVTSLETLRFEGFQMPITAFQNLQAFVRLCDLSLDRSMVLQHKPAGNEPPCLAVIGDEVLDAARLLLQAGTLTRVSACGTPLGEVLGHARGQVQAACLIETVRF